MGDDLSLKTTEGTQSLSNLVEVLSRSPLAVVIPNKASAGDSNNTCNKARTDCYQKVPKGVVGGQGYVEGRSGGSTGPTKPIGPKGAVGASHR
jgi:hypothetical protein